MKKLKLFSSIACICVVLVACDNGDKTAQKEELAASADEPKESMTTTPDGFQPNLWPKRDVSPPRNADIEKRVAEILAKMSVEEKVGQIIQPEIKYATPADVKTYHLGSVLNGGGTTPNNDKFATVQDWANLAEQFYQASMDESDGNVGIPVLWGSDAVHGNNNVYGSTLFPHNIGLGAAGDPDLMYRIGQITAIETGVTGVDWTFGPTVAVARDDRWGRTYESYSEDPKIVMDFAREMVRGIQGDASKAPGVYKPKNLIATAKHFVGDGGTTQGIDRGDTEVSEKELVDIHAAGYISALDGNVLTTMASFNSWNGNRLHGHKYLLTDILKNRMGFDGFIVGDWNAHMHVPGCTVSDCPATINAGLDMVMVPSDWKELITNTIAAVKRGDIPMTRLDDAVSRILRVKLRAGLFDAGPILQREYVGDLSLVGHADHRALAREAVRKSLVLLKNNNGILPLSPKSNILIAGDGADNIGKQAGGWTLSWQGTGNKNEDFPGATSIYAGIQQAVEAAGGRTHLDVDGQWDEESFANGNKPDVAIVVYGEEPYAEWHGDLSSIEFQNGGKRDINLLKQLKEQGIPVVSIFISGRPLWVNPELNASDAFVAAWLPGSEGVGVADVLMRKADGDINHDFTGKLSFSWPKTVSQAVLNVGDENYDPLFAYGYGLSYSDTAQVSNELDESSVLEATDSLEESWIFVSREMSQYQFKLSDQGVEPVLVNGNRVVSADDENLLLLAVDKVAQEDARRFTWKGMRPATVSLDAKNAVDLSQYYGNNSALSFSMKVDQAPAGEVTLSMVCQEDCSKQFSLSEQLTGAPTGEFVDYKIDLRCLVDSKIDMKEVTRPFVMTSTAALDVTVSDIKIVPEVADDQLIACDD